MKPNHSGRTLIRATHPPTCKRMEMSPLSLVFKLWPSKDFLIQMAWNVFLMSGLLCSGRLNYTASHPCGRVDAQQDRVQTYQWRQEQLVVDGGAAGSLIQAATPARNFALSRIALNPIQVRLKDTQNGFRANPSPRDGHVAAAGTDGVDGCRCQVRAWRCQGRHEESRCSTGGKTDLIPSVR